LFHLLDKIDDTEKKLKEKKKTAFISQTTMEALRLTIHSVLILTRDLLENDFNYVLTGKLNQDCLEVRLLRFY